jgi:hypothetical protein
VIAFHARPPRNSGTQRLQAFLLLQACNGERFFSVQLRRQLSRKRSQEMMHKRAVCKSCAMAIAALGFTMPSLTRAIQISPNGEGEALIFPYYTVRNGAITLISIVNTASTGKILRLSVRESKNASEVMDVEIYLSGNDVWTAAIIPTADGAKIISNDKSCPLPAALAQGLDFRNGAYLSDRTELRTLDRTREGHIQVLESAAIEPGSVTDLDITPDASGNRACQQTNNASQARLAADYIPARGGLFGSAVIVNSSMSTSYQAIALSGMGFVRRQPPQIPFNLVSGTSTRALILESDPSGASRLIDAEFVLPADALDAVLMRSGLIAEYSTDTVQATDWVLTAPTKRRYTNNGTNTAKAPFQNVWNGARTSGDGTACDDARYALTDRESKLFLAPTPFQLCWATTVATVRASESAPSVLGSVNTVSFATPGPSEGFGRIDLTNNDSSLKRIVSNGNSKIHSIAPDGTFSTKTGSITFSGLPVVGLAFYAARFSRTQDNYGSSVNMLGEFKVTQQ